MANDNHYDVVIIGAGPGGYETAIAAAHTGRRVALVERAELGGTCLNRGCIPTKALAASARTALAVANAAAMGIATSAPTVDMAAVVARKDTVVAGLREGVASLLGGVDVITGEASITPERGVSVDGRILTADRLIIATGSRPARLNIPGAELALTSDEMLSLTSLPRRLVIIGGGVIGVEFASIMSAFGSEVTLLEYCPEILPPFDAEVAKRLRMAVKRRGIKVETSVGVTGITPAADGSLEVKASARRKDAVYQADVVMMAVGRRPVVPEGTIEAGIECTGKGIVVDPDTMATSAAGVYAIGDVNGLMLLAHAATAQGRVALGLEQSMWPVPSAVFSEPEAAMTGLTEAECEADGIATVIGRAFFRANGKAVAEAATDGLVKVIVDKATGQIAGAHIVGPHAADLIQELSLAIASGIQATEVVYAVHAHPTLGETVMAAVRAAVES